jgi:NADPH-dependent 2,4-dienoyl-CoA reductase/sulfur reductase-like enzyme
LRGHGRFEAAHRVRVDDAQLEAEKIFINVGARAFVPDIEGIDAVDYLTNSSIMEVDFLPEHLIIIGGSYIGLEFAQMYRRFGSRVTVVELGDRLIARDDEDVSAAVKEILENEGIDIRTNARCLKVNRHGEGVAVAVECDSGAPEIVGSHLLLAHLLEREGLSFDDLDLLDETARGETDLGLAVLEGRAEAGLAIEAVARSLKLGFVPLLRERYDLLLRRRDFFEPPLAKLFEFTRSEAFGARAAQMGGYDVSGLGATRYNGP